ncbi:MAG: bifunctional hydroxymethylpyrimidine kinase/phosphomethylpyrimidine kinase [Campylobacterales bacterium]|nr:bifunctional hydroxymethylpyrimidine kinase/phosphomethylpyrimidine kinase [Campylobacterales bacterium]
MQVVLTIAGSDSSGGAGIQADLKTFEAFGVFGASAITVLTAQNTTGVRSIQEIPVSFIKEQIEAVFEDFDVAAVKVGMLYSKEIIEAVGNILQGLQIPIVFDPVFISKVGSPLLQDDAVEAMKKLFKYATVITPNMYESQQLFGSRENEAKFKEAVFNTPCAVLVKHKIVVENGTKKSYDELFENGEITRFESQMLESTNLHGTGCSYSSAIAANLALGNSLHEAIKIAKSFIYNAIKNAPNLGNGAGPVSHKEGGLCC